jgi:chromosome segregation ATPase
MNGVDIMSAKEIKRLYGEIDSLKQTIKDLERRQGVVSIATYTELEENHQSCIEEIRASHKKIADLEKDIRMLKGEIKQSDELLEQIVDLKQELSKVKGRENIYSREDYNRVLQRLELSEQETTRSKQDYEALKKRYEQLKQEHITLNDKHNELKQSKSIPDKVHNERGAGRKPLDKSIIKLIQELKNENKTIKEIKDVLEKQGIKISVGAIHGIVKGAETH